MRSKSTTVREVEEYWTQLECLNLYELVQSFSTSVSSYVKAALTPIRGYAHHMSNTMPMMVEPCARILNLCTAAEESVPTFGQGWPHFSEEPKLVRAILEELVTVLRRLHSYFMDMDRVITEIPDDVRMKHAEMFLIMTTEVNRCNRLVVYYRELCAETLVGFAEEGELLL